MKKYAILMSAFLFLTAAGCSDAPQTQEQETTGFKIYVDEFTEAPTEAVSEADTSAAETSAETEASEPAETTVSETEAAESEDPETSAERTESEENVQETATAVSETDEEILGTWEYAGGYGFRFMENGEAEIITNYSGIFHFEDGQMYYGGDLHPMHIEGNTITFTYENETTLVLESDSEIDPADLNGRYKIGQCALYDQLVETSGGNTYYIEAGTDHFWLLVPMQYRISGETLCLVQNGSELVMTYHIDEEGLHMTDENGAQDVLTRVE